MNYKTKNKSATREVWEEDVFDSYLAEMNTLINKYPADPNSLNWGEEELTKLIDELDESWIAFQKRWQQKLKKTEKIFATARVKPGKSGMRHLIIKSEFSDQDVLDLSAVESTRVK